MNFKVPHFILLAVSIAILSSGVFAQQSAIGTGKAPTTKIYLAEAQGESEILSHGVRTTAKQATAFDAPGTVIETKPKSHNAFVYSNGTGLFMEENTRIQIDRFAQERFQPNAPNRTNPEIEPSTSHSEVAVTRGIVGICTNQLTTGTTMVYTTPQAVVTIRRGRISIETNASETIVDLLEGDITVAVIGSEQNGQVLQPGERAIVRAPAPGLPLEIVILKIPEEAIPGLDERTNVACNAKRTVFFDANDQPDQEITPNPTVPQRLPTNITVSPDRLPGSAQ